jgi:hypothetical protein
MKQKANKIRSCNCDIRAEMGRSMLRPDKAQS